MNDCVFCKIIADEIPSYKIYEDNEILAFLDLKPVNPGHTLIVPKKHFNGFTETPDDLLCKISNIAKIIGSKIIESKTGEGFNIIINNGRVAGQVVDHFHLHLVPRNKKDGRELWKGKEYTRGEEEIVKKIKIK